MLAQVARDIHQFDLDVDAFKVLESAFAYLLPSTPNTHEGVFADWMLLALKALEASHPAERFLLMLDGGTLALRLTYLNGKPLPSATRDRFADDFYEAFEVLTVLRDQHAARAAFHGVPARRAHVGPVARRRGRATSACRSFDGDTGNALDSSGRMVVGRDARTPRGAVALPTSEANAVGSK